jgi:small-conductance mechanosensitive channel
VKSLLREIINGDKHVTNKEYTNTIITAFDNRGITFKSIFFSDPAKKAPAIVARDLQPKILETLKKYGIRIPSQHMTITA